MAYPAYAATCSEPDLDEWFNFRGLGGLRPSWLESNYNDRVLRRMLKICANPTPDAVSACNDFASGRLAYRDQENVALALREMVFDTADSSKIGTLQDGDYMGDPS